MMNDVDLNSTRAGFYMCVMRDDGTYFVWLYRGTLGPFLSPAGRAG